ncbi:MAG: hypothetical protein KDJ14_12355 [Xanthomonadales bacterium]|nr:hypothetical protein [Xanthomonadales bacterium]
MIAPRGTLLFILGLLACAGQPARAGEASQRPDATASSAKATAEPAPAWYLDDVRALSSGSGRWIADNAGYRSDDEPFDAYGVAWTSSFGGTTLHGRLFGLREGKEVGTFWEFRQYWDPLRGVAVLEQFGHGGTLGLGTLRPDADGSVIAEQRFARPGGTPWDSGHRSRFLTADRYETRSFDIVDGAWNAKRVYVWVRQAARDQKER